MNQDPIQHETRRATRRALFGWSVGGALVLCAVIAAWAYLYVPKSGPAATAQQNSGAGILANQGSGSSTAAQHDTVTPQTSRTIGTGQNSPAEAADIEKTATPLKLTDQQRQKIKTYFADNSADRLNDVNFALSVGAAVPQKVQLQKLPPQISSAMGGFQGDQYVLVRNQLVVVEPNARRVVAIVPGVG